MSESPSHLFDDHFHRETLRSERLRAKLLAVTMGVIIILILLVPFLDVPQIEEMRKAGVYGWMLTLGSGLVLYELVIYFMLGRLLRTDRRIPLALRYWNSFVEVSLPTAATIVFAYNLDPTYALISLAQYLYFLFIILSILRMEFGLSVFTGCVAAAEYLILAYMLTSGGYSSTLNADRLSFAYFGGKGVLLVLAGIAAGFVTLQFRKRLIASLKAVEDRNTIVRMFGEHVAPAVVNELLNNSATIGSSRKQVSVMFVDIRGFTTYAEKREPEEVVAYLNRLFGFMIEIVNEHHGIVHQLLGDGMMAIFGAPLSHGNDAGNAVRAARAILHTLDREQGTGAIPPTRIGIGIHAGEVLAGTIGTSLHKEYKITGDVVNLAARIEQLNKEFDTRLLVSGEVWRAIDDHESEARSLGMVNIKGREEPVEIIRIA